MEDELATGLIEGSAQPALGKYIPLARLSQGGMAEVLLAIGRGPVGFNKLSVIKLVRNANDSGSLEMFFDEARLSARLSHPNIVNTYDVGEANGQYFLAMEYLEGQSLHTLLAKTAARGKPLDEELAAFIAAHALRGLHYAHELSDYDGSPLRVVHRDVSPHNLFLTYRGEVKLLDFGIAKATLNFTHTDTGVFKGKVRYMAPEQLGDRFLDRRADVFAVGVVLWEMLAGRALYSAKADVASIFTRISGEDPPLLRTLRPDVCPELEAIVAKALRRDRDVRYASADEMRSAIEHAFRGRQERAGAALVRMLDQLFAETRESTRARIQALLARLALTTSSQRIPTISQPPDSLPPLFGEARETGTNGGSGSGRTRESLAPSLASPVLSASGITMTPERKSSAWPWIGAGAVALGTIVVIVLRQPQPLPSAGAASPQAAEPLARPAPAASIPPTTPVHLETAPAGALVEWNGRPLARTPADLDLPSGAQGLKVSFDGYEPVDLTINVKPGEPLARAVALRAKARPAPAVTAAPPAHESARFVAPPRPVAHVTQKTGAPAATAKIRVVGDDPSESEKSTGPRAKIRVVDDGAN